MANLSKETKQQIALNYALAKSKEEQDNLVSLMGDFIDAYRTAILEINGTNESDFRTLLNRINKVPPLITNYFRESINIGSFALPIHIETVKVNVNSKNDVFFYFSNDDDLIEVSDRFVSKRYFNYHLTFTNNYRLNSFVDLAEIEAFFEARLGRNESFCLPSWQEDLRLSADTSAGVDYLPIQTHDVTLYIGQNILVYKAGSYFVRTITSFGDGYIELNSGIPFTVTTDDSISIIYRVTFASDSLELAHQTSENVDIELSFVEEIREAGQVSEIIDTDTDLNAICYSTMTEAQYLLLEETDYALLTTSCEALGDGDGIVTAI